MSIVYRKFKKEDTVELKSMIFSLYEDDPEGIPINEEKIKKTIEILTSYPEKGEIIIFEKENLLVGYSILINYWSNEYGGNTLNIDELYVKPSFRRKGLATNFMNNIFEKYKNNVVAFMLEVTPANKNAYEYYSILGFRKDTNTHMIRIL